MEDTLALGGFDHMDRVGKENRLAAHNPLAHRWAEEGRNGAVGGAYAAHQPVYPHRKVRNLAPPLSFLQDENHLLGAAKGKGRDQNVAAALDGLRHLGNQALLL